MFGRELEGDQALAAAFSGAWVRAVGNNTSRVETFSLAHMDQQMVNIRFALQCPDYFHRDSDFFDGSFSCTT